MLAPCDRFNAVAHAAIFAGEFFEHVGQVVVEAPIRCEVPLGQRIAFVLGPAFIGGNERKSFSGPGSKAEIPYPNTHRYHGNRPLVKITWVDGRP